jgi:dTMP kinase
MSGPGLFVVVEGPSGVGKSTVTPLVAARLTAAGASALATSEPTRTELGDLTRYGTHEIRGLAMACLVAADRYHHLETTIRPALAEGTIVVCDRYLPSSLVLQTADGVPEKFVWDLHRHADPPDLTVVLIGLPTTSRSRAATRGTYSRFHEEGELGGVAEQARYLEVANGLHRRGLAVTTIEVGPRTADEVTAEVSAAVLARRRALDQGALGGADQ